MLILGDTGAFFLLNSTPLCSQWFLFGLRALLSTELALSLYDIRKEINVALK